MKNKILLAGVAVLALTATNANAVTDLSSAVTIHPQVDLVGSFGLQSISELKFGVVVVPEAGHMASTDYITVTPESTAYGNVTLLGGTLGDGSVQNPVAAATGTTTVAAGELKITGDIPTLLASRPTIPANVETGADAIPGASVGLIFADQSGTGASAGTINLVSGQTVCGTVSNITLSGDITEGGATGTSYRYGGKLTFTENATAGMHCVGNATVTMVFNE